MTDSVNSLRLFLDGFAARDLAEPLASFDETAPVHIVRAAIRDRQYLAVGIRHDGVVRGWMATDDIPTSVDTLPCRSFDDAAVIHDDASLNEVVHALNARPVVFVRSVGQVGGLITRLAIQKPAMRMWLFGLVTITEQRVTRMIDEVYPHDSWQQLLSSGRVQKARDLQAERMRRGQVRTLLECLQIADKGRITARDARLRERTQFRSQREVEDFVMELQNLRNNLAHAQDLSDDWNVICEMATNLHRIVIGPSNSHKVIS